MQGIPQSVLGAYTGRNSGLRGLGDFFDDYLATVDPGASVYYPDFPVDSAAGTGNSIVSDSSSSSSTDWLSQLQALVTTATQAYGSIQAAEASSEYQQRLADINLARARAGLAPLTAAQAAAAAQPTSDVVKLAGLGLLGFAAFSLLGGKRGARRRRR